MLLTVVQAQLRKSFEEKKKKKRSRRNNNNTITTSNFTMPMPSNSNTDGPGSAPTTTTTASGGPTLTTTTTTTTTIGTSTTSPPRHHRTSSFDISLIPSDSIRKRELRDFSVHYNVSTSSWLATIARPVLGRTTTTATVSCARFSFRTETEARNFAKAYSPPKMIQHSTQCVCCAVTFHTTTTSTSTTSAATSATNTAAAKCNTTIKKSYQCTNCGGKICDGCSRRWGARMVPKTYLPVPVNAVLPSTVRVCKSCQWSSNAFCMALLQGNYNNAVLIHATGNINLRCSFADISKEAMFPIHCAVMGGNLDLVKWLVDGNGVPMMMQKPRTSSSLSSSMGQMESVQTSKGRTLMDLVMTTGRRSNTPKVDILSYLVQKGMDVSDAEDPSLAGKMLQTVMNGGYQIKHLPTTNPRYNNSNNSSCFYQSSSSGNSNSNSFDGGGSSNRSMLSIDDACIICCEKKMNCVLSPCGHQMCCSDCGNHLTACPICKRSCNVLRIFKS